MRKTVLSAALAVAALPVAANAAFVVTYPSSQLVPVNNPGRNNFATELAGFGIKSFASTNATITLTTGGMITFEYFAKEALNQAQFNITGLPTFTAPANPVVVNNFPAGVPIGSAFFTNSTFNPTFSSIGLSGSFTIGSGFFGIGIPNAPSKVGGGSFASNTLWLMYDDNAVPDDNHDDLIIRATFAVPEPSTWAMMILGFGVIGLVMRRRTQQRVSFV